MKISLDAKVTHFLISEVDLFASATTVYFKELFYNAIYVRFCGPAIKTPQ